MEIQQVFIIIGAKKALRRRVLFELGCDLGEIEDIYFMGKIFYSAQCDEIWGENESIFIFRMA